jgi:hypothetical protein
MLAITVKNPYNQVPEECKGADPERDWCLAAVAVSFFKGRRDAAGAEGAVLISLKSICAAPQRVFYIGRFSQSLSYV